MKSALLILLLLIGCLAQGASLGDTDDAFRPERIEILISANTFSSIESFFGHSSILVIPEGGSWEDGRVFDFLAATNNESNVLKYYAKGASGQFPFTLVVSPVRDFLFKRLFIEQRSVQRLILPTSPAQRQKLWEHLLDLQKNPKKIGDYYFVRYNCATAVLAALKYSDIQINTKQIILQKPVRGVRPTQLSSWLRAGLLTPFPEQSVPSVLAMVESLENRYRQTLRSQPNRDRTLYADWPAQTLALLPKLSTEELLTIANILLPADQNRAAVVQQILRSRPPGPSRLIHFRELPQAFYDVCENSACAQNVVAELKKLSSEKGLQRMALGNEMQFADSWLSFMPEINFETSPQVHHWKLLNEALSPYR
jgi:hypothetical protein